MNHCNFSTADFIAAALVPGKLSFFSVNNVSESCVSRLASSGPSTLSASPSSYSKIQAHKFISMLIDGTSETPRCSLRTSNTISLFDISLIPNIQKRTTIPGSKATKLQPHHWITIQGSVDQVTCQKFLQEEFPEFSRDKRLSRQ